MLIPVAVILGSTVAIEASRGEVMSSSILENSKLPPAYKVSGEWVSIVIPTYKEEDYIEDTLVAIVNQTYEPIEVVVSDASDEESMVATQKITDMYSCKFVHTFVKNISLGRNLGAEGASGKILIFLDADCIMANDFVERLVNGLKKEGIRLAHGVDVFHPGTVFYRQSTRVMWNALKPLTYTTGRGIAMYAKDFWELGGYDENIDPTLPKQREDLDLGSRVAEKWGKESIFIDRYAYVSEPPRRPISPPGMPAWRDRAWRSGEAIDGIALIGART
jgi:glycosyltransferase involved in cell wall biosynthesis